MIKIPVIYVNGQRGIVNADELEALIRARKIISFRRSSGWVRVAFDLIRGDGGGDYSGPDRRELWMYRQIAQMRLIFREDETNRYVPSHRNLLNRLLRHIGK
jgi:hypothetical protein